MFLTAIPLKRAKMWFHDLSTTIAALLITRTWTERNRTTILLSPSARFALIILVQQRTWNLFWQKTIAGAEWWSIWSCTTEESFLPLRVKSVTGGSILISSSTNSVLMQQIGCGTRILLMQRLMNWFVNMRLLKSATVFLQRTQPSQTPSVHG